MNEQSIAAVIGAGTMGHGIAQVLAQAGFAVRIHDQDPEAVARGVAAVAANLDAGVARGKVTPEARDAALSRLSRAGSVAEAAAGAVLVVEAVVERLAVKRAIFQELEGVVAAGALLASNTSSLPIRRIAEGLARPERVLGMHFFNPVHIMALVEVVVHPGTADDARERALAVVRRLGKEPIVVKDTPGFATSRLGVVLGLEAMRMLEQGVASAEDIDKAMALGYRHPMGPLRLTDLVGLDVRLAIAETLQRELGGEQYAPPEILRRKVAAGELGRKSGRGFYEW